MLGPASGNRSRLGRRLGPGLVMLLVIASCSSAPSELGAPSAADDASSTDTTREAGIATRAAAPDPTTRSEAPMPPGVYVDPNNGRDGAHGTHDDPFLATADAMAVLQPGDTLYFRGGVYDDRLTGHISGTVTGTPERPITLRPFPGEEVTIIGGGEWGDGIDLRGSSHVIVEGFRILGRDDSIHGSGVRMREGSHDIVVRHNYAENFGLTGVAGARSSRLTIEYNELRGNARRSFYQGSGISLWEAIGPGNEGDEFANVIRGNLVVDNFTEVPRPDGKITDGNCIIIDFFKPSGYEGSTLIENNVCIRNGGRGIHIFQSSSVVARNNTLIRNGWTADLVGACGELTVSGGDDVVFHNNLIINEPGVAPYIVGTDASAMFSHNAVLNGEVPPGVGNRKLTTADNLLASLDPEAGPGSHRPLPGSLVVASANPMSQPEIDQCGAIRPSVASIGALELRPGDLC